MPQLNDIGEDELVRRIIARLPQGPAVITGPGDDCAVVQRPESNLVLKVDAVVEGVHFLRSASPRLIGRKAIARAISDMAAMAATPRHALVTVVLPADLDPAFVDGLYEGLADTGREFGVSIVGGETARGPVLMLSVALTGEADAWVTRSGGRAGDLVFVTGRLGGSIQGHHFTFQPRVAEARWLAANVTPTAMMDLSDGLARDLPRLALACGTGFELTGPLPCTPGCDQAQAWGDGEDYELLFAIPPDQEETLCRRWPFSHVPLSCIGRLTAPGEGQLPSFGPGTGGWDHFATST